jgi:hypothetical protein
MVPYLAVVGVSMTQQDAAKALTAFEAWWKAYVPTADLITGQTWCRDAFLAAWRSAPMAIAAAKGAV